MRALADDPADALPVPLDNSAIVTSIADGTSKALVLPIENKDHPIIIFSGRLFLESNRLLTITVLEAMLNPEVKDITILMESPGGQVDSTIVTAAAIQATRGSKPVRCVVLTGGAYSSAYYLLQTACTERIMVDKATLGTHRIRTILKEAAYSSEVLIDIGKQQEEYEEMFDVAIAKRMGMVLKGYKDKIANGDWEITSKDAIKVGAVDKIVHSLKELPNIPLKIIEIEDKR